MAITDQILDTRKNIRGSSIRATLYPALLNVLEKQGEDFITTNYSDIYDLFDVLTTIYVERYLIQSLIGRALYRTSRTKHVAKFSFESAAGMLYEACIAKNMEDFKEIIPYIDKKRTISFSAVICEGSVEFIVEIFKDLPTEVFHPLFFIKTGDAYQDTGSLIRILKAFQILGHNLEEPFMEIINKPDLYNHIRFYEAFSAVGINVAELGKGFSNPYLKNWLAITDV